ncbi:MAG TPA: class I SAM-dependent methyltransferase, partial [Thermoanaerobaculia bacterium]|nr:class I SAM-dependent methyltransferase [Thermoanaerobaculia bacterium]
ALALLAAAVCSSAQETEAAPIYQGRRIANVMSYHGAPWLERDTREQEETPAALLAKLALRPGQKVADLGCGSGFYSRRMARLVAPEGMVYAVDIQPEMLRILEAGAHEEGITNIVPILGETDDPKLPPGAIDWILLVDVYHELQQPEPVLAKMREALAPGGRVALVEFRLEGDTARQIKIEHRMSVEQVLAEWEPAGFDLVELWEELPMQHLFIFKRK